MQLFSRMTRAPPPALQAARRSREDRRCARAAEYLRSLNDGRRVFVDGERVEDVTTHPAFREAARSIANLFDIAADPALRERMTFPFAEDRRAGVARLADSA